MLTSKINQFKTHPNRLSYLKISWCSAIIAALLVPELCFAHASVITQGGFKSGVLHPLTGLDHGLAMLAVGLLASKSQNNSKWLYPGIFLSFMVIGCLVGFQNISLPWTEMGITASVFILGLLVSAPKALPKLLIAGCVAIFAVCHGHAHGNEMTPGMLAYYYIAGFLLSTALLHIIGISLGQLIIRHAKWLLSITGLTVAASSLWL